MWRQRGKRSVQIGNVHLHNPLTLPPHIHDQLMGPRNERETIHVVELLRHVLSESIAGATGEGGREGGREGERPFAWLNCSDTSCPKVEPVPLGREGGRKGGREGERG